MNRCVTCRGPVKTKREKAYRYAECGLSHVVLENAVDVATCMKCGETYTGIPAIEGLHRVIAAALIRKKQQLAPEEIRFLRKSLGWSGVDFARHVGTKPETVSRSGERPDPDGRPGRPPFAGARRPRHAHRGVLGGCAGADCGR